MRNTAVPALALLVSVALTGCGSGGDSGSSDGSPAPPGEHASKPIHTLPGIKGEAQDGEAATNQHISGADCRRLRHLAEAQTHVGLDSHGDPTAPNSRCRLTGPAIGIGIYLDTGRSAHQRYQNRMTEQNQFAGAKPGRLIHPVPLVGEPGYGNENASWVPDLSTIFATRGNRWLTVAYNVGGVSSAEARSRAAALAILGFRLTAHEGG